MGVTGGLRAGLGSAPACSLSAQVKAAIAHMPRTKGTSEEENKFRVNGHPCLHFMRRFQREYQGERNVHCFSL